MAEPLKHILCPEVVRAIARDLAHAHPSLCRSRFIDACLNWLDRLELAARASHIADAMHRYRRFPDRKCERFLAASEIAALGAALSEAEARGTEDPFAIAAIRFLLLTGCRRGEALSLRWEWVDFERRVIRFRDSKTGAKVIALGAPVLELLDKLPIVTGNSHVFASTRGKGSIGRLPEAWERIRTAAGLGDVRLHDLRHSFASVGASGGQSLLMIGKLLGHRTASSTQRYAHPSDDPLRSTADRIAGEIAAQLAGKAPARYSHLSMTRTHKRAVGGS